MTPAETFAQSRIEAENPIRQHAPARLQDAVIERLLPAIALDTKRARDVNIPIGASKFFGAPDVPEGFEWPLLKPEQIKNEGNKILALWPFELRAQVKKEDDEVFTPWPLEFWAQINLSEIAPLDGSGLLPISGSLLFFFDSKNQFCVLHVEGELTRAELPQYEDDFELQEAQIYAQSIWSIPLFAYWSDENQDDGQPWDLSQILNLDRHPHYLLGNPQQYVSDRVVEARVRAAYCTNRGQPEDWILLLQMSGADDDPHLNVSFGEYDCIFFLIHRDDLAARDFSRCHVVYERQF